MTKAERQVAAVVRRLTAEPIGPIDRLVIGELLPGKKARWCTKNERRFLRDIAGADEMTARQRRWLYAIAWRYRARLSNVGDYLTEIQRRKNGDRAVHG